LRQIGAFVEIIMSAIDSQTVGNSEAFRSLDDLKASLAQMPRPKERGRVSLLMFRGEGGQRVALKETRLDPDLGVPGDAWGRDKDRHGDMQIAVMEEGVAKLIANGQPLELFGDCLMLDLDLSRENLPPGSRVKVGQALLEVTPMPHNGCSKFQSRFGKDALRFVVMKELRHNNLRGTYMRVIESGVVRLDDQAVVLSRPALVRSETSLSAAK
jgi:MOSC domain-containing protein YiiM